MHHFIVVDKMYILMLTGVPRNISFHEMKQDLLLLPGVEAVHSLNIWSLTLDKVVVTVHLAIGVYDVLYMLMQIYQRGALDP